MNKKYIVLVTFIGFLLHGCVTAPPVHLDPLAKNVRIAKSDPSDNYEEIGPITATDGQGCGAYGYRGTYDRAITILKNKTYKLGADYVQIYNIKEPYLASADCFDNDYTINGSAYKKVRSAPSAIPITNKAPQSTEDKLKELNELKNKGLITEEEYKELRKRALQDIIN